MKRFLLKHWSKLLILTLVVIVGVEVADIAFAANDLASGGGGLNIAGTGDVKISGDIVQDPTLGETVVDMVNFFIGFLLIASIYMQDTNT